VEAPVPILFSAIVRNQLPTARFEVMAEFLDERRLLGAMSRL
jgi:hypothetical protein